jgi:hypothetical protein
MLKLRFVCTNEIAILYVLHAWPNTPPTRLVGAAFRCITNPGLPALVAHMPPERLRGENWVSGRLLDRLRQANLSQNSSFFVRVVKCQSAVGAGLTLLGANSAPGTYSMTDGCRQINVRYDSHGWRQTNDNSTAV